MLFPDLAPKKLPDTIQFLQISALDIPEALIKEAALITADPPWPYPRPLYDGAEGGSIENHYTTLTIEDIEAMINRLGKHAVNSRLALWCTWPRLDIWMERKVTGWKYKTGGSWLKEATGGVGYHWLGVTEPVLIYTKGSPKQSFGGLKNGHRSPIGAHSEKPWDWEAAWLERWTEPGDLVLDVFAGRGPMARACYLKGRRYVGIEIEQSRIEEAESAFWEFCTQKAL